MHSRDRAEALVSKIPDQEVRRIAMKSLGDKADMNSMVYAFHRVYGLPVIRPHQAKEDFSQLTKERLAMRFGLIVEEFMELCEAMDFRADINFLYENEDGDFKHARHQSRELEQYFYQNSYGLAIDHNNTPDDKLHQIVRERIADAIDNTDERSIPDVADACFDLKYVIIGFEYEVGIEPQFCAMEGQASNLSKLQEDGTVKYREDGKVLKGPNFFRPDMAKALRAWDMKGL